MKLIKKYKEFGLYKLEEHIYAIICKSRFDLAMHFLRLQESYENPNIKFRRKYFEIIDFIEWYSKKHGKDSFSYPRDFDGFNITSSIFKMVYKADFKPDKFDKRMMEVYSDIKIDNGDSKFTLMGIRSDDLETITHELAHAYWYLYKNYRRDMKVLLNSLPNEVRNNMNSELTRYLYDKKVFDDETQAYLSTGLISGMKVPKKIQNQFKQVFNKYHEGKQS